MAGKSKRELKAEELQERVKELCKSFAESDTFKEYLVNMRRFKATCARYLHAYSARNMLAVMAQDPTASIVGSYQAWKEMGRPVRKGERSRISVWVPIQKKAWQIARDEADEAILDEDGNLQYEPILDDNGRQKTYTAYTTGPVFDVSQTEGDPLPTITTELTFEVDRYDEVMNALRDISELPIYIDGRDGNYPDLGAANGYCMHGEHIAIRGDMPPAQTVKTCVHEIVHSRLHSPDDDLARSEKEIQAEGCAFLVCEQMGLDTSDYSIPYLFSWDDDRDEMKTFSESVDIILDESEKLAAEIEMAIQMQRSGSTSRTKTRARENAIAEKAAGRSDDERRKHLSR